MKWDGEERGFPGPLPSGRGGEIVAAPPLPIEGSTEIALPVERLWEIFTDVGRWREWNPCIWRSHVRGGPLRLGARLVLVFNAIRPWYPYKLPATATIVEFEPQERVTWEATTPGFHAVHAYRFAGVDSSRCLFGSWEVADGAAYRATRRFWLAHFRYVCRSSLSGSEALIPARPVSSGADGRG